MEKVLRIIGFPKGLMIFHGVSFYPNNKFDLHMAQSEYEKLRDHISILEIIDEEKKLDSKPESISIEEKEEKKPEEKEKNDGKLDGVSNKSKNRRKV